MSRDRAIDRTDWPRFRRAFTSAFVLFMMARTVHVGTDVGKDWLTTSPLGTYGAGRQRTKEDQMAQQDEHLHRFTREGSIGLYHCECGASRTASEHVLTEAFTDDPCEGIAGLMANRQANTGGGRHSDAARYIVRLHAGLGCDGFRTRYEQGERHAGRGGVEPHRTVLRTTDRRDGYMALAQRDEIRSIIEYAERALDRFDDGHERSYAIADVMMQQAVALSLLRIGDALDRLAERDELR